MIGVNYPAQYVAHNRYSIKATCSFYYFAEYLRSHSIWAVFHVSKIPPLTFNWPFLQDDSIFYSSGYIPLFWIDNVEAWPSF